MHKKRKIVLNTAREIDLKIGDKKIGEKGISIWKINCPPPLKKLLLQFNIKMSKSGRKLILSCKGSRDVARF